jgi:hypothetical protein
MHWRGPRNTVRTSRRPLGNLDETRPPSLANIGWPSPPGPYEATAQIGVGGAASPARQRLTVTFLG